jgi:single-stranded-DNA-specific exonuclease
MTATERTRPLPAASSAPARALLGVEQSITGRRWVDRLDERGNALAMEIAQRNDFPELLARVLAGRGVSTRDALQFLDPAVRRLMPNPSKLTDMDKGAARIADAVQSMEKVAIFGDYDVDGATSAALLERYCRSQGMTPLVYIPDRLFEGYGPNPEAIDSLIDGGATLIVTVDCGTASIEALQRAEARGVDVVVIDHHLASSQLPPAVAVINPNRDDDLSGLGHLAAVGLVFMTLVAVNRELRRRGHFAKSSEPQLLRWLDLVALGTVCDVVGLTGLNRAFVVKGLIAMRRQENPGIAALSRLARLNGPVEAGHLGFLIGPRINAGGRIGNASLGAQLLATEDVEEAERIATELDRLNTERQALEAGMLAEAMAAAEPVFGGGSDPPLVVTHDPGWHIGVVGLIASRLKDRFMRPAFAIADGPSGLGVGSGRSIPGIDIGRVVKAAVREGILVKGGGHAMAAGITLPLDRLHAFEEFVAAAIRDDVETAAAAERDLKIDAVTTAGAVDVEAIGLLERAGPFGAGHPPPMVAFPAHHITYAEAVGSGHVRAGIAAAAGRSLKAMAFRAAEMPIGRRLLARDGVPLHVAGILSLDHWQGAARPTLKIVDIAEVRAG